MDAAPSEDTAQLENWVEGVAEDLEREGGVAHRRRAAERPPPGPSRPRPNAQQSTLLGRRLREAPDSSPEPEVELPAGKKDLASRPKLPRPEGKEACPRCSSLDTKFCYYNNYNIKQPRFYCKTCQRYWTAGGTLRNIAPGSGRRKSKAAAREGKAAVETPDHLPGAGPSGGLFSGLPIGGDSFSGLNPALLSAADGGLLGGSSMAASALAQQQLLGQGSLGGLGKLSSLSAWQAGSLPADIANNALLREHLQTQLAGGGAGSLAHQNSITISDARLLLGAGHHLDDLSSAHAAALLERVGHAGGGSGNGMHVGSGSPSPSPPPQQQQLSSPPQPGSQLSQQPSHPHAQHNGSASDGDGGDDSAQGRRVRIKGEPDMPLTLSSLGSLGNLSSLSNAQLAASLNLPPSMTSLAAVMGPGGGGGGGGGLPPLLGAHGDMGGLSLLDASVAASGLGRHHLHLALQQQGTLGSLQQHQAAAAAASLQQQHGSLLSAVQSQHALLQELNGLGEELEPLLSRSSLLQQAAGLGGMGGWLQAGGGGGLSAAAALDAMHAHSLGASSAEALLLSSAAAGGGGGGSSALQLLQAQAQGGGGGGGGSGWGSGWPSWSSLNTSSGLNAGYALQAAAAAAYSGGR